MLLEIQTRRRWAQTHVWSAVVCTFKSRGSILKDANTSGGQAEAHGGGLQQSGEFHRPLLLLLRVGHKSGVFSASVCEY